MTYFQEVEISCPCFTKSNLINGFPLPSLYCNPLLLPKLLVLFFFCRIFLSNLTVYLVKFINMIWKLGKIVSNNQPRHCLTSLIGGNLSFTSNMLFQLHHSVHNMSEKPLGLFWQFRLSTSNYNDTLYYKIIQDLSIQHKTSDRAERQFTQLLLSDGGQKKAAGKKPLGEKKSAGNLGRNHGSTSKQPILRGY